MKELKFINICPWKKKTSVEKTNLSLSRKRAESLGFLGLIHFPLDPNANSNHSLLYSIIFYYIFKTQHCNGTTDNTGPLHPCTRDPRPETLCLYLISNKGSWNLWKSKLCYFYRKNQLLINNHGRFLSQLRFGQLVRQQFQFTRKTENAIHQDTVHCLEYLSNWSSCIHTIIILFFPASQKRTIIGNAIQGTVQIQKTT